MLYIFEKVGSEIFQSCVYDVKFRVNPARFIIRGRGS